jgi:hypothetical protein
VPTSFKPSKARLNPSGQAGFLFMLPRCARASLRLERNLVTDALS